VPNPEIRIAEIPESGANAGQSVPNARVEAQIQTGDVSSAHQFFTAKAGGGTLPGLTLNADASVGQAAASAGNAGMGQMGMGNAGLGQLSIGNASIGQAAMGNAAIGQAAAGGSALGHAALAHAAVGHAAIGNAALAAMPAPGAEQISPLVQLILKMPGFSGMMNSFFEFLGSLFSGNLIEAFNPAHWADQLASAISHAGATGGSEHFGLSLDFLDGGDAPILSFDGDSFHSLGMASGDPIHMHTEAASSVADAGNVGAPVDNVDLEQAIFEKTSNFQYHDYAQNSVLPWQHDHMALGPGSEAYKPGLGGYYSSGSPSVTPATTTAAPSSNSLTHHAVHHGSDHAAAQHAAPKHFRAHDVPIERTPTVQASDAPAGNYTVQHGDNLFEIARDKLGNGNRWGEIFKLNADVIGQNPDLIHAGLDLKMPEGGPTVADSYTVQPGDSLWRIGERMGGGGEHWGNIYHANEGVIGSNPDLIMPGQQLNLHGIDANVASGAGGTHHHIASLNHGSHAHAAHGHAAHPHQHAHVAHANTASPAHIAHANAAQAAPHEQHVAMVQGANTTHGIPGSHTTTSAQGIFKEQTPVLAPVDGNATSSAGGNFGSSTPTSYTGPSANES
jgi:nucleoid-associated protein YgaU